MGKPLFRLERYSIENENMNTKNINIDLLKKNMDMDFV